MTYDRTVQSPCAFCIRAGQGWGIFTENNDRL